MTRAARLLAVLALVVAAGVLLAARGSDGRRVTAVFEQAHGLVKGGQVVAGGVPVGTITSVELADDGLPRVSMRLDDGVHVRQGARADLRQLSNSGQLNRYVLLELGSGEPLRDGAVIPAAQTAQPVEIDQVLDGFQPALRADLRAVLSALDTSTERLAPAFEESLRDSAHALRESAGVLDQVATDGRSLQTLVGQGAKLLAALRTARPELGATVDELSGFLQATSRRSAALGDAVTAMPEGLRQPRLALERLRGAVPELEGLVRDAAPATAQLRPAMQDLGAALPVTGRTLAQASALARRSPADLRALAPLLPSLRATLQRMTPVLRASLPILDNLRVYSPDIMGLLSSWSSVESTYDAVGHGAHIFPTQVPPPSTPQPPSSNGGGYIAAPYVRTPGAAGGDPWLDHESSFLAPPGER